MSFLSQTMNAFTQAPILGLVDLVPSPQVIACQLSPSTAAVCQVGSAVKLIGGQGALPIVDVCSGPTDGPVFGVIPYNNRKNTYAANDILNVAMGETFVFLRTSAAVNRGAKVTTTAATTTTDPTVATVATPTTQYVTGVAIDLATGADQLIRIKIAPSFNLGV